MDPEQLGARMRARESYRDMAALPGAWIVARVDGRGFSRLTSERFDKPFDARFHELMVDAARALIEDFQGVLAYTQSDEISLVLPPDWALFARRVEKIVSLTAAQASARFSVGLGEPVQFDARVWLGASARDVADYVRWRAADAARCALSTACYWTLRNDGASAREASRRLEGASVRDKNELLFARGINFNALPVWQRRGVILGWETYLKQGYDPIAEQAVEVERRRVGVDEAIPMKDALSEYVLQRLSRSVGDAS